LADFAKAESSETFLPLRARRYTKGTETDLFAEKLKGSPGLKPLMILRGLRGPEGPLFHGDAGSREFFAGGEGVPFPK
jgi:hypothetical protein